MHRTLLGKSKTGPYLDSLSTKHQRRKESSCIPYTTSGYYRYINGINHLRHQSHSGNLSYVTPRLHPLGYNRINPLSLHSLGEGHRCNNGNYPDPCLFQHLHILPGITSSCGYHSNLLFHHHPHDVVHIRGHKHDIYTKRLARPLSRLSYLLPNLLRGQMSCRYYSKASRL